MVRSPSGVRCQPATGRPERLPRVDPGSPSSTDRFHSGRVWSWLNRLPQCGEAFVADAVDLPQLLDGPEAAVRVAVLDDPAGKCRSDAVEHVELRDRRRRQADRLRWLYA